MASMNWIIIGSVNGLLLIQCQAIAWINEDLLSIGPLRSNFSENWSEKTTNFFQENASENIFHQMKLFVQASMC